MLNRIGIKCASMILFMMFVFTSCVGSFRGNAETVNLPQRAVIDYDETISQVDYVVWDYNDDGYNESIDFSLLLKSTGPSESVSLRVKLWNSTTLIKEDILYAEATLQGVSVAWWFDASKTDYYTFNFTLYDESHSKEEDWYNLTNILLETPGDYYVSLEAVAFDDDGDHCNDDIRVHCEDPSGPVLNADVYIDGEFYGFTNANGNFEAYDFTEGYHTIDIFYGQFHNSTWVYTDEISSGGNMMSLTFETFDDDDDGYKDDVKITAYSDFNTVVIGAVVTIDGVNVGMTGLDGSITAYDFEIGWHYVTAQRLMLSAYGEFYSEGSGNENPYDEYFYLCEGRAVALDDDLMLNDIAIEIDVDIPGGEGNVTTVAKLYDSSDELIDMKSHTYYAIGYNYDEEYINFSNLNWEEYHLKYELFDEDGNLEDTREQTITLLKSYGYVNVEHLITDEQGDTNLNDVIFYAHLKNEVIEDVVIKIYNENGELCATVETDASGIAEKMNLAVGEYNWEAFAENGTKIEEGAFRILQRTVTGTAQVGTFSYLTDYDGDSYHDDFVLQAYNAAGNSVNYINVAVYDMASYLIDDGLTVNGEYVLENIAEGWYSFVCTNQLTGRRIATGIFYSYGQINENARININAYVFADDGMWLNDVTLKVTNATGAPVRNAQVLLNNNYLGMTDIDGEITTYDLAQGWYKADAYYLTGHAYCRFYSEGEGFEEYFYSAEIKGGIADGDGIRNDIITKFDVDIDGGSDTVKVVAEAYYDSNGSLAKSAQISYLTSGSDWDEVYLNITNLSYEVYDVTLTLYDSHGNYMDTYSQEDVSLYNYGTEINVDTYVFEWDYDGLVNDILFTAHIAGEPVEGVLIELYHQNGLMESSAITNEHGEAYFPDLTNDTYYFESMMNGNITEKGWIVIRSLSEMARSAVLTDYDYDNYYDDFKFECYNTTSGYPADFRIEITKPDGSVMSEFSSGVFILEDLPRGNYSYKVYLYVNSNEILFENCTFFSYGTPYKIYVKAETFDEDGDTYKDDVKIHAYDSLGVNASGGELYIDNVYVGNLDINGNYTGYNFAYGNHIVKVYYNGSTGYTTFFSMGDGTQSAFWNIIVYLDGDNNLESAGVDDISEMEAIGSINGVNILVLFDKWSNGDTRAYYVKPGSSTYIPISSINPAWGNELNMGDPATLVTFVNWVNDNYPANKTFVILWDHGGGWDGVCWDDTNNYDYLTMSELNYAFMQIKAHSGNQTIIGFDACLMAMIEVDFEIYMMGEYRAGSEESEPGDGWDYRSLLENLTSNPAQSIDEFSQAFTYGYVEQYGWDSATTQSVTNLTRYEILLEAVDEFSNALMGALGEYRDEIWEARNTTEYYGWDFIDLYHFTMRIKSLVSDDNVQNTADTLQDALEYAITSNDHGAGHPNSYGISIYFPSEEYYYDESYEGLTFALSSRWDEFLNAFYGNVEDYDEYFKSASGAVLNVDSGSYANDLVATVDVDVAGGYQSSVTVFVYVMDLGYNLVTSASASFVTTGTQTDPHTITILNLQNNSYIVRYVVKDSLGKIEDSKEQNIVVGDPSNHAPNVVISSPANNSVYYTTDLIPFDGSGSSDPDGDMLFFEWSSDIDGLLSTQATFTLSLSEGTHTITLKVTDEHGFWNTKKVKVQVYESSGAMILLVDDDGGSGYERFFTDALNNTAFSYEYYSVKDLGNVPLAELMSYQAVVWFTGSVSYNTLDANDMSNLSTYLSGGGKLFITGQDIGYDIGDESFYTNYLHAKYISDDTNLYVLNGISGDPISDGITITIQGGDGANNQGYPSEIEPLNGATSVFKYNATAEGGIKVDTGVYRVVYFAFGFEAINNPNSRTTVMEKVITWLLFAGNILPVANAGNDITAMVNEPVTFYGSGSDSDGTIVKYEWDFDGDGTYDWSSASSGVAVHTYTLAGVYNATLRVTDNAYGRNTDSCKVTVNAPGLAPVPVITLPINHSTNTTNDLIQFDGSQSYDPDGDEFTYEWISSIQGTISTLPKFNTMLCEGVHRITLRLVDENGAWAEKWIEITVNKGAGAPILLVDDDDGYNYERYFTDALNSTQYSYDIHTIKTQGEVPTSKLMSYAAVIWFVGADYTDTLTSDNMVNLSNYLDAGGRLFITGQDVGYEIGSQSFYTNYLHATYVKDDSGIRTLSGVSGDPISNGMTIGVSGGDSPTYTRYLDVITPINGASAVFMYNSSAVGGLKVDTGTYRVVYYAFSFECVNNSASRADLMKKTVDWLLNGANLPPMANAGPDLVAYVGDTVMLNGTGLDPDGIIVSYSWDFEGDGIFDWSSTTTGHATHVYTEKGVYSATLKITNSEGLIDYDVCKVTVLPPANNPPVANAGIDQTVHAGHLVYLNGSGTDSDGYIVKYEWDFNGDGTYDWSSSTNGNATYTYMTTGTYNAVLRVTDDFGLVDTDVAVINVINTPPVANAGPDQFGLVNSEIVLAGSGSDSDGYIVKYEWDFEGDGTYDWSSTTSGYVVHVYSNVGSYNATLRVTDNIGAKSIDSCVITITDVPNEPPVANAGADQTVYLGGESVTVHLVGTGTDIDGSISKYEWDFEGDGTYDWYSFTTGIVDHDYTTAGVYNATLRVTDNLGATDTDVCVITVIQIMNQPPVANAGNDQTVPMNAIVYLNGSGIDTDGYIVKYEWDFNGDGVYDWSNTTHGNATTIYPVEGVYTAVLRVKDNYGATAIDECIITVYHVGNYPPVANAGPDIEGYQGEVVYLNGSGTDIDGTIVKYEWDFNNDTIIDWTSTSTGHAVYVYSLPGNYTAKLRVTDNNGTTANDTCKVVIYPAVNHPPIPNAGPDRTVYDNEIVYLNGSAIDTDGTIVSWEWDINGDGIYDYTGQNVQIPSLSVGVYHVTLKVVDDDGAHATDVCNITVIHYNLPPIANAGPDMSAIVGEPVTFAGLGEDPENNITLYQWDFNGDGIYEYSNSTTGTFTYVYTIAGNFTAVFKVTDGAGAYAIDTCNVTVRLPNQPPVANAGLDKNVFTGENVTFNGSGSYDSDGSIVSYEWDVDGNGIYDYVGKVIKHVYTQPGIYIVVLRVVDNLGASDTDTCVVNVTKSNSLPVANAGLDFTVRAGEIANLQGSAIDLDGYIVSYAWSPLGNGQFTQTTTGNFTYIYTLPGTYTAVFKVVDNDGGVGYDNCTVTVLPANIAPVANAGDDFTVFVGSPAYFHGTGSDADGLVTLFEWDFNGDGTYDWSNSYTGEAVYTYSNAGVYNATLRVTDDLGKSAIDKVKVTVRPPNASPIANAGTNITVIVGTKVTFDGKGTDVDGKIVLYEWDFDGDGIYDWSSQTSGVTNYTYTIVGTYYAKLRVRDNDGAMSTAIRTITVNPVPNKRPIVEILYHGDAYVNVPFYLNGSATDEDGTIVKYEWDLNGDGIFEWSSKNSGNAVVTFSVPGTIVCTFRATDDDGDSESVSTTVTIRPQANMKPTISITSPKNGSEVSGIVTITGYASDDTGVAKVEIKIDGGAYVTVQGTTAWKYDWDAKGLSGNHLITAKATDISGASTEVSINLTVTEIVGKVPTKTGSQGIPPSMLLIILIIVVLLCAFIAYKYSAPRVPHTKEKEIPKEKSNKETAKKETEKETEKKEDKKEKEEK